MRFMSFLCVCVCVCVVIESCFYVSVSRAVLLLWDVLAFPPRNDPLSRQYTSSIFSTDNHPLACFLFCDVFSTIVATNLQI